MTSSRRSRCALALAGAGLVASSLAGPLAAPGLADEMRAVATPAQTYAQQVHVATNKARVDNRRAKITATECLRGLAAAQAQRMANAGRMFNQDLGRVLRACDLDYAGENVAYGFPNGTSVVTQGWMRSAGHRANLMNKQFTVVGIAARKDKNGTWYVSQVLGGRK